jgi:hypothetical protein
MATGNLTQAQGVLKIVGGMYTQTYETEPMLFNRVEQGSGNALSDRGFEIATEIEGNWAHGWLTDGGDYPAGGSITTLRPTVFFKEYAHSVRLTGRAINSIKPDTAYIKSWTEQNLDGSIRAAYKMANRYAWGLGAGVLAQVSSGANSTTQTINATSGTGANDNVRYLGYGMKISIFDTTLTVLRGTQTITSFPSPGDTTITLDAAINTTTGDLITISGGLNNVITGMQQIVDDTTNAGIIFQGVNRNTYHKYRARLINASSDGLDPAYLRRMLGANIQVIMGSLKRIDYEIWTYMSLSSSYAALGWNLKRYDGPSKSIDLGYTSYDFEGIPWVEEVDCPKTSAFFIKWNTIKKFVAKNWGWDQTGGNEILRPVPSATSGIAWTNQYEGYYGALFNYGCTDPRANGQIINFALPTGF